LPGRTLWLIHFLDARSADGRVRKYPMMCLGGELYPAHLAIAGQWKVHYFSSAMAEDAGYRAEEEAFLTDPAAVLGERGWRAVEAIRDVLGLDYGGMDFSLNAAGDVLLFEANAAMTIHPPEPSERWAYRRAPIARILDAARNLPSSFLR